MDLWVEVTLYGIDGFNEIMSNNCHLIYFRDSTKNLKNFDPLKNKLYYNQTDNFEAKIPKRKVVLIYPSDSDFFF